MSRNQSDFTPEQKVAVASAALDGHMSAREVAAAAQDGQLGVPSFSISPSSVSTFTREERDRRRADPDHPMHSDEGVRARLDVLHERIVKQAEHALDDLEAADEIDVGRLKQLYGLVRSLAREDPGSGPASPARLRAAGKSSGLIERLAAAQDAASDHNGLAA